MFILSNDAMERVPLGRRVLARHLYVIMPDLYISRTIILPIGPKDL